MARRRTHLPEKQGLYDPAHEKENCGVGFVAHLKGERSHQNRHLVLIPTANTLPFDR